MLKHFTKKDSVLVKIAQNVQKGKLWITKTKYKHVFRELSMVRGDRLVVPKELRADILALAHEGHPGMASMLQQLRQEVWWPGMTADLEEFVATFSVGCGAAVVR